MTRIAACLVAVLACLEAVLLIFYAGIPDSAGESGGLSLSFVGFLLVGAYSVVRRPRHRVGWAMVGIGIGVSTGILGEYLVVRFPEALRPYIALLNSPLVAGGFALIGFFLLWYPTGEVPSQRWLWLERAMTVLTVGAMLYYLVRPGELGATGLENPIGLEVLAPLRESAVEVGTQYLLILLALTCLGSLVVRYRRGTWTVRQQIRLILYPALAILAAAAAGIVVESLQPGPSGFFPLVYILGYNGIALGVGVAIFRYRLYDIDRVISRTVSYVVVVGLLGLVFAAGVVLIPTTFGVADSQLLVAGSTLAVAALFNPLRTRVRMWVDRRFNRPHYDAARVMDGFADSLRDRVDPDGVAEGWLGVVAVTMQPVSAGVWVRES
jgi:hypothetical protein